MLAAALKGKLTDAQARTAAGMLESDDVLARGLAWWAIATKVGLDNKGWAVAWPRRDAPEWFRKFSAVRGRFHVEADYVKHAVALGIHCKGTSLLSAAAAAVRRAEAVAAETGRPAPAGQLAKVRAIRDRLAEHVRTHPADLAGARKLYVQVRLAARPLVLADPAIDFDKIVFVTQFAAHARRNITRSFPWKHKPGGDICVLSGFRSKPTVRGVLGGRLGPGFVWGLDLWPDADRVVFSFARQDDWPPKARDHYTLRRTIEPIHIFEADLAAGGAAGRSIRQLTDHDIWSDFEPTYCPNGDVVFSSDRKGNAAECGQFPNDVSNPNLYVVSPGRGEVRHLIDFKDLDRYPHGLDSGLIAFTRWEYQERHFMEVHAIWTVRPDGTGADALFGHHLPAPLGLRDTRSIPGSTKLVAIATGHHTFAHGPVVVIDPGKGLNNAAGIEILTPGVRPQEGRMAGVPVAGGGVPDKGGLYRQPFALSERSFLVCYAYDQVAGRALSNGFGLYVMDTRGNRELLHRDPLLSCAVPIPLRKRPRPHMLPSTVDASKTCATCTVPDVYEGVKGLEPGSVRYIRISQHLPWPLDAKRGKMPYIPGNAYQKQFGYWSWSPVRVIGTVPVESDGSAHFTVPVDTAVYFQVLDANHMELVRMRSMISFKGGEVRSCRGCHETRRTAPPRSKPNALAMRRGPSRPDPPPWGGRVALGYEWLIQPILDEHCIRCHGGPKPEAGLDFRSARGPGGFFRSFRTMFSPPPVGGKQRQPLVAVSNRFSNSSVTRPKQFGSHRSPLVGKLLEAQGAMKDVKLTPAQWLSLVTWIDANAPYHDTYINKRPADGGKPRRVRIDFPPPFGK